MLFSEEDQKRNAFIRSFPPRKNDIFKSDENQQWMRVSKLDISAETIDYLIRYPSFSVSLLPVSDVSLRSFLITYRSCYNYTQAQQILKIQRAWRASQSKRNLSARLIQTCWKHALADPGFKMCQKRLLDEFLDLKTI